MQRYPAFDPPEYVDWTADPEYVDAYRETLEEDEDRARIVADLDESTLLRIYRDLLRTRLHDIGLKRWVRTGVISKAWLSTGEEAVTVGNVSALDPDRDVVCPMIRNAGALHMMGMPLADMFRGYLATPDSPTGGRDIHIGDLERGILQPVSHMGANLPVMAGVALSFKKRGEPRVGLTWVGDGSVNTQAFHEGINFAATQDVPAIVVIQNNQVALGTTVEKHRPGELDRIPDAYGVWGLTCDGNNVLDVLAATRLAVDRCRAGEGPAVLVATTFRMGGHATHDEKEAREAFPEELFLEWGRRDPIGLYEAYLEERDISRDRLEAVEDDVVQEMDEAAEEALTSRERSAAPEDALYGGFSEGGTLRGLEIRPI